MKPFDRIESEVRSYIRSFPVVFSTALGAVLTDEHGKDYIDFFAGAGALNYGHNNPELKKALVDYLMSDGITHSLDMATTAKRDFLLRFEEVILKPRGLEMKMLFPGPTGTNAVEAALKLARKATGREGVVSFTNGFHGMTLGSLAITGNQGKRDGAGVPLGHTSVMPFDGYHGDAIDTVAMIERMLTDHSSGVDVPAAFVVETVQAEGGVNVASMEWLERLAKLAKDHDILLIIDDIQAGCGRTGRFFSFEEAGIDPDMVCLSKSLSGFGLPMAMVLVKPEFDVFHPGEHNGTFRGHMPAFVTATKALDYWTDDALATKVAEDGERVVQTLERIGRLLGGEVRGRGMMQGVAFDKADYAGEMSRRAFEKGVVIETAGPDGEVLKVLAPLVIPREQLDRGLEILEECAAELAEAQITPKALSAGGHEVNA